MKAIGLCSMIAPLFRAWKPVYDGLQKIKFEKPRAAHKAEYMELKQFYAARRKLTGEFPDGKVDMKKLSDEATSWNRRTTPPMASLHQETIFTPPLEGHKSCVDTAARFNERVREQKLQNRPQTRQKKEELSRMNYIPSTD